MGVVTPVPKPKGNPLCMDDHHPIVVGPALGKLFSIVLMRRLDTWAEDAQLRATTQFGFRQSQGMDEGSFLLKHVIDSYRTLQNVRVCESLVLSVTLYRSRAGPG